jgi:hypothetical protein
MKIKRLNHEGHEEHEGKATKNGNMCLLFFRTAALPEEASLREVLLRVLRVLRGSIFRSGFSASEVTA